MENEDKKIPARNATPARNDSRGDSGRQSVADGKPAVVETYAEDVAHMLESDTGGLVKKIIHSEEEDEEEERELSPESKKNKFFMLLGASLLLVSLAFLTFFFFKKGPPSVEVPTQFTPLIFTDKNVLVEVVNLKKEEITKKVFSEVNTTTVKAGGVEAIYLTLNKSLIGLRKFIETIDGNFVLGKDNFVEDNFLTGVVKDKNENKSFFILLKIRSVADIFEPIHAWENKMFTDLHGFFGVPFSSDTKYLITKNFEDGIVENKNARILYDNQNGIVMLYVFGNDNSVIITTGEAAAREIIHRLASGQILK